MILEVYIKVYLYLFFYIFFLSIFLRFQGRCLIEEMAINIWLAIS